MTISKIQLLNYNPLQHQVKGKNPFYLRVFDRYDMFSVMYRLNKDSETNKQQFSHMENPKETKRAKKLTATMLEIIGVSTVLIEVTFDLIKNSYSSSESGIYQITVIRIGLEIIGINLVIAPPQSVIKTISTTKAPSFIVFSIRNLVLIFNLSDTLIPLRNPAVYQEITYADKVRKVKYTA